MTDGFKMRIENDTDKKLEYEKKQRRKNLRKAMQKYYSETRCEIKNEINTTIGVIGNIVKFDDQLYVLGLVEKKLGDKLQIHKKLLTTSFNLQEGGVPIHLYVENISEKTAYRFYEFAPMALLDAGETVDENFCNIPFALGTRKDKEEADESN